MSVTKRIITHSMRMFITHGVKTVRMDDIAAELGISKRTIYELMGDKESLIRKCIDAYDREIEARHCKIMAGAKNIIEEFLRMMEVWEHEGQNNYQFINDLCKYYPAIYNEVFENHSRQGYEKLRTKLEGGVSQGLLLSNIDFDLSIAILSHSMYGIFNKKNMLLHNVSEKEAFQYVITYFLRGIATHEGIEMIDAYIKKRK